MTKTAAAPQTRLPFVADDVLELVDIAEAFGLPERCDARPDTDCGQPTIYDRRQCALTLIL
jgi:hypothetical protein